ncbi:MAG: hypothetical protein O3B95_07400, partial [Chloroflexi bacterium]|nr:hypothetical protein [Chloroflexota bacterium]
YLVEEYGDETMAEFLAVMNAGAALLPGFEQVYGRSLYEVENTWRASFNADPLPIPSATSVPTRTANQPSGTTVPLVDYGAKSTTDAELVSPNPANTPGSSGTVVPVFLPTTTPAIPSAPVENGPTTDSSPGFIVTGVVIGLSVLVGLWLFTSRRSKLPTRKP